MVVRLRRRSPLLGVIVPLALLLGQVSAIVHSMVVEHERCREHGELVHRTLASGAGDPSAAVAAARALGEDRHTRLGPDDPAAGHGHEHCLSLIGRRDALRAPGQPVTTAAAPPAVPTSRPATPATLACDAIFVLAPKTSPPATATG
jgi:hypothetical protein